MDENIRIINTDEDNRILFYVPNSTIIKTNRHLLDNLLNDKDVDVLDYFHISKIPIQVEEPSNEKKSRLGGLIFNVTETCNLACTYCMVSQGTYDSHHEKKTMTSRDCMEAFTKVLETYHEGISLICFFGGEPMTQFDTIKEVVSEINGICHERQIEKPDYSIITNGTIMNDEVINFLNQHQVYVSISIDGVEDLHDSARVFRNGKGSFNVIKKNLEYIKETKGRRFPLYAECTIHKKHLDYLGAELRQAGYNYVKDMYALGFDTVYVFPVDSKDPDISLDHIMYHNKMQTFYEGVYDYYMELLLSEEDNDYLPPAHFIGVFGNLMTKKFNKYCRVGKATLFVNPLGELYPCHLFYQTRHKKMGDIANGFTNHEEDLSYLKKANNRFEVPPCKKCHNRYLCFLWCAGSSLISNGSIASRIETRCRLVDITVQYALKQLVSLKNDKKNFDSFKKNIRAFSKYYRRGKPISVTN